jgi:phosphate-selective porin OprO and OprP
MPKLPLLSTTLLASSFLSLTSTAAFADDAALKAQVIALEAKIARLEKALEKVTQYTENNVTEVNAKTAHTPPNEKVKITMAPSPKFATEDGNYTFNVGGFVQTDGAVFADDESDQPNGTTLRRARLNVSGTINKEWGYKFENDFADNSSRITYAFVSYSGLKPVTLTLGQFKEPFSLEELTSDRYTTFLERASVNIFAPSRTIGFQADTHGKNWSLAAGVFGASSGTASSDDEQAALTARATYAPLYEKTRSVHLGIAGSMRKPDESTNSYRFSVRPESRIANVTNDTGNIVNADNSYLIGLEAATVWDSLSLQGEYIMNRVTRDGAPDVDLNGGYVQASWFMTGESRNYNPEKGVFERISPRNPFSIKDGGAGAWELAARYSTLDLTDSTVDGGDLHNYTLGVNWYINNYMRVLADYIYVDSETAAGDDKPQILSGRFQIDF